MIYEVGQFIIYGSNGVCQVEAVGPLEMCENEEYYTLRLIYQSGVIYAPVEGGDVYMRPVVTREEAETMIAEIPDISPEIYENSNPRVLGEHYQTYLRSYDCRMLLKMIRSIYAKKQQILARGRRLGQVDERNFKQAQDMLHGEFAIALGIPKQEVAQYIAERVGYDVTF